MNTKATEKDFGRDSAFFERLPEETKELMKLKDHLEKTTGPAKVEIARQIKEKARKPRGNTPPPDEQKTDPADDAAANSNPARPKPGAGKRA